MVYTTRNSILKLVIQPVLKNARSGRRAQKTSQHKKPPSMSAALRNFLRRERHGFLDLSPDAMHGNVQFGAREGFVERTGQRFIVDTPDLSCDERVGVGARSFAIQAEVLG